MESKWRKAKHALGFSVPSQRADGEDDHNSLSSHPSTPPPVSVPDALSRDPLLSKSSSTSSSQSQNTCSICLCALEPGEGHAIFTAECSHSFHFHCITSNVKQGNQICPVCRANWKDIPFQRANHPARVAAPHLVESPSQSIALMTSIHRLPPHSRRHLSTLSQDTEPAVFDDDEPLGQPDHEEGTTSGLGAAGSSCVKTVDVRTYTEVPCVERNKSVENFTILIHLKAATNDALRPSGVNQDSVASRTPVDLVTVLDISGSMEGSKLALLKRAMGFVIHNLSSNDRLSVVAFSSTSRRLFPLLRMTESGRERALHAVNCLSATGGTNIAEGLRKGAKVMEERRVKNPVASIILLSDGQDSHKHYYIENGWLNYQRFLPLSLQGGNETSSRLRIPVHTFGFGADHDASLLHSISEMSGGTFSFIETEATIQDAFAQCIGGLLSVVVQELRVGVECMHPGIYLTSINAGSYITRVLGDGRSGYVDVGDLYAEEERDFLVLLNIPPAETCGDSMLLLEVKCVYKDPVTKETVTLESQQVKIVRPETVEEELVSIEVDRQRNRLQAAEAMRQARAAAEGGNLRSAASALEEFRNKLALTASAKGQDQFSVALDAELKEMQDKMTSKRVYEATGRAYILSGMSSHSSQRATARGSSMDISTTRQAYQTPSMMKMVQRSRSSSTGDPPAQ